MKEFFNNNELDTRDIIELLESTYKNLTFKHVNEFLKVYSKNGSLEYSLNCFHLKDEFKKGYLDKVLKVKNELYSDNKPSKFIIELTETELYSLVSLLSENIIITKNQKPDELTDMMLKLNTLLKHYMREFNNFQFVNISDIPVKKETKKDSCLIHAKVSITETELFAEVIQLINDIIFENPEISEEIQNKLSNIIEKTNKE